MCDWRQPFVHIYVYTIYLFTAYKNGQFTGRQPFVHIYVYAIYLFTAYKNGQFTERQPFVHIYVYAIYLFTAYKNGQFTGGSLSFTLCLCYKSIYSINIDVNERLPPVNCPFLYAVNR